MKLNTTKYLTDTHTVSEAFENVFIAVDTARVELVRSTDDTCRVVCYENEKVRHAVSVEDATLTVKAVDGRRWYDYIGISFDTPTVTVYLPQDAYGNLTVQAGTGDVILPAELTFDTADVRVSTGGVKAESCVNGTAKLHASTGSVTAQRISVGALDLKTSTGKVQVSDVVCAGDLSLQVDTGKATLTDVTCQALTTSGSTGDITCSDTVVRAALTVSRSTGDVQLERCDAAELFITTDTGAVRGSLLTEKVFITQTDTGRVNVPKTVTGGRCEITTDTGNIEITIAE